MARRATKTLTISRLPPVLLIQLKRFTTQNGVFWDKSETPVIFPIKDLDLTRYVPYRLPTGKEDLDDPRTQVGPFKYDLYGVSNHMGTLSSGHCELARRVIPAMRRLILDTAYVKSSKGWMYCEDSRVSKAQDRDVVVSRSDLLAWSRRHVAARSGRFGYARGTTLTGVSVTAGLYPVSRACAEMASTLLMSRFYKRMRV